MQKPHIPASFNMYLVINNCVTAVKVSNFSGHYLRNRSTLGIGVLGYIGIVQHKEHSPEVLSTLPGTPCIKHSRLHQPVEEAPKLVKSLATAQYQAVLLFLFSSIDIYITAVSVFPPRSLMRHSQTHPVHFLIMFQFSYHREPQSYLAHLPQLHINASCAKRSRLSEKYQQHLQKLLPLSRKCWKATHCVRKMYQLDANNFTMIFSHKWPLHVSDIYMSIFRNCYI